jgi:hypothetical protein
MDRKITIWFLVALILILLTAAFFARRAEAADAVVTWNYGPQPPGVVVTQSLVQWNQCGGLWSERQTTGSTQMLISGLPVGTNCFRVINLAASGEFSDPSITVSKVLVDTDGDGISDPRDNCTQKSNSTQIDADGDGYGNICDGDFDNNGYTNGADSVILRNSIGVVPVNMVTDINSNGVVNAQDTVLHRNMLGHPPGPSALPP